MSGSLRDLDDRRQSGRVLQEAQGIYHGPPNQRKGMYGEKMQCISETRPSILAAERENERFAQTEKRTWDPGLGESADSDGP